MCTSCHKQKRCQTQTLDQNGIIRFTGNSGEGCPVSTLSHCTLWVSCCWLSGCSRSQGEEEVRKSRQQLYPIVLSGWAVAGFPSAPAVKAWRKWGSPVSSFRRDQTQRAPFYAVTGLVGDLFSHAASSIRSSHFSTILSHIRPPLSASDLPEISSSSTPVFYDFT